MNRRLTLLNGASVLLASLMVGIAGCGDPPHSGNLRIDIDRTVLQPGVSALNFTLVGAQVFYDTPPPPPLPFPFHRSCDFAGGTPLDTQPQAVHLDLTHTGLTFVGAAIAPAGKVSEIRLLGAVPSVVYHNVPIWTDFASMCESKTAIALDGGRPFDRDETSAAAKVPMRRSSRTPSWGAGIHSWSCRRLNKAASLRGNSSYDGRMGRRNLKSNRISPPSQ